MSFTFNDLNGSKSNATVACSTNSPSKSNLNTDDIAKKTGDKTNLIIDSAAISGSKSESNSSLFVFGNSSQKKNSDLKTSEGFNFIFNSNSFNPSSSKSNTESKVVSTTDMGFGSNNNLFEIKEEMEPKLEDKAGAVFDSDNNNENSSDSSNENSAKDEVLNSQEQKQNENASNVEMMVVKTLVKEFKEEISSLVSCFVKERIEGERKIAALEGRIQTLEEEVQNLKSANLKESSSATVTNNNDTAKPMVNSVAQQQAQQQAQQSLELPPSLPLAPRQTPSPLSVPSLAEASTLKKSLFGSTTSLFGCSSAPLFNGNSNSFGSISSSLGNDTTALANTAVGTSMFNSSVSTQTQAGSQLFGASMQASNQSSKNFVQEPKQVGNPKKLFTHEAVTTFLNAQKDPGMNNNLTKVNTGNPSKKMATGQGCSEQNQNTPTKEAFQANLQRTIEMSVKKFMEEFWKNSTSNASEDNFQKFNGNLF